MTVCVSKSMRYTLFINTSFLLVICSFMIVHLHTPEVVVVTKIAASDISNEQECESLDNLGDYRAKCLYLKSNDPCASQGYIDYLYLFYCKFGRFPSLGYTLLFLWLLVLFYLLANTTSEYFCPSLESLSKLLRLSPTIAGVTLLSLGNGACDVFSSLVSFQGSGTRSIGFNTVLGGVSFVSCVVVGSVSIATRQRGVQVVKSAFVRDVYFLLLVLLTLFGILVYGRINVLGAIGFTLMYAVYVVIVYVSSRWKEGGGGADAEIGNDLSLSVPLLKKGPIDCVENGAQDIEKHFCCMRYSMCRVSLFVLEMPLYLPRRLTIPIVCEERWSKVYAVSSVILSPLLLSFLWRSPYNGNSGFVMSVTWSYIIAQELVGLLVSIGYICRISPSMLGLTVLAWGNSIGDLMTNLTMALNGGQEGVQVAISGCYAGPIFNTLIGLGLSLVTSTWSEYPEPVVIPKDPYLWETMVFLVAGSLLCIILC
nr:Cation/calcium exchanger 4 [Cajanus cajan]